MTNYAILIKQKELNRHKAPEFSREHLINWSNPSIYTLSIPVHPVQGSRYWTQLALGRTDHQSITRLTYTNHSQNIHTFWKPRAATSPQVFRSWEETKPPMQTRVQSVHHAAPCRKSYKRPFCHSRHFAVSLWEIHRGY